MKWFVASDIHGSEYYCKKLVDAYKKEGADRMLLLGDILYHGPRNDLPKDYNPKSVIEMLNGLKNDILCVRGNCDTEVDQMVLDFPIMADYAVVSIGKSMIYATHGHTYNDHNLPPLHDGDMVLQGHTHVPRCEKVGDVLFLNPGSVSIPKDGSANSYMIIEDDKFVWKTLEGEEYKTYNI